MIAAVSKIELALDKFTLQETNWIVVFTQVGRNQRLLRMNWLFFTKTSRYRDDDSPERPLRDVFGRVDQISRDVRAGGAFRVILALWDDPMLLKTVFRKCWILHCSKNVKLQSCTFSKNHEFAFFKSTQNRDSRALWNTCHSWEENTKCLHEPVRFGGPRPWEMPVIPSLLGFQRE